MFLSSRNVETLSVSAVCESIALCPFLSAAINENDREPSWDGYVYIYNNANQKKEHLLGKIAVQVKGRKCSHTAKKQISYSMSTSDLNNYLNNGGVILFVVYVGNTGSEKTIYYAELPPIKLRVYLNEAKAQKNKNIHLKLFPKDNNKKANIFFNCYQNCHGQASFSNARLLTLEELERKGVLEGVSIPVSTFNSTDPLQALLTSEVYIYANIKGSAIPQPLCFIPENLTASYNENATVKIGDKIYYSTVNITKNATESIYIFGESFKITYSNANDQFNINYKNSKKIRSLAKDMDFMLSFLENGYFYYNDIKIPFDTKRANISEEEIAKRKEHLAFTQNIVRVLDVLNCHDDIILSEISEKDFRWLNILIDAFVNQIPIDGFGPNMPLIVLQTVCGFDFLLYFQSRKDEGDADSYYIKDFFSTNIPVTYSNESHNNAPVSQYAMLKADDILRARNIKFENMLSSFQDMGDNDDNYTMANFFLLELLSAYDMSNDTRKDILNCALAFSEWLYNTDDDKWDKSTKIINYLQTIKRCRELNEEDKDRLYLIIENKKENEANITAAYLLLDEKISAKRHFNKTPHEQQKNLTEFPIWRFWN